MRGSFFEHYRYYNQNLIISPRLSRPSYVYKKALPLRFSKDKSLAIAKESLKFFFETNKKNLSYN